MVLLEFQLPSPSSFRKVPASDKKMGSLLVLRKRLERFIRHIQVENSVKIENLHLKTVQNNYYRQNYCEATNIIWGEEVNK